MVKTEIKLLWIWGKVKEKGEIPKAILIEQIRGKFLMAKHPALALIELLKIGAELKDEMYRLKGNGRLYIDKELDAKNIKAREEMEAYRIEERKKMEASLFAEKKKIFNNQMSEKLEEAEKKQKDEIFKKSVEDNKETEEKIFGE